jgi:signal transduction histidine kinase
VTQRRSSLVTLVLLGITAILLGAAVILLARTLDRPSNTFGFRGAIEILTLAFALVGGVLARRRPENPIGWIFLVASLLSGVQVLAQEYAVFALAQGDVRGARIANWIDGMIWVPITGSIAIFLSLLFPNGRPPSRRWWWVLWTGALGILVFTAAFTVSTDTELGLRNPFFEVRADLVGPLFGLGSSLYLASVLAALVSLTVRFRRSQGDERQQLRWFGAAVGLVAFFITLTFITEFWGPDVPGLKRAAAVGSILSFIAIPVATGVAVMQYRLYDIDIVISKTVVYGLLAAFVTIVYVAVVVGMGALVGSRGNLLLSIFATAVIALAFQPIRERARRLANRLVYGKRATPYEAMSEFAERMAGTYSLDEVLPRMARIAADGTGADRAEVWVRVGNDLHLEASSGAGGARQVVPAGPSIPGTDRTVPVTHQDEVLGAIAVVMPRSESLAPTGEKLLGDLASQAGLVLRNVRLIEELRASRQRLVTAQDEERRRLERNLHDGAQQQLVALSVKMRLLKALARKDPEKAEDLLDQLQEDSRDALDNLRDLARGIYPPLLADQGLAAALEAQARKAPLPVDVDSDGVGRYTQDAEATAYFCVLEALQNIAKYANASRAVVRLDEQDGHLVFSVSDDGEGFEVRTTARGSGLQNMTDRLEAVGGFLEVMSAPGRGATVTGRIPLSGGGERSVAQKPHAHEQDPDRERGQDGKEDRDQLLNPEHPTG